LGGGTLTGRLVTTASAESDSYSGAIRIAPSSTQQWGGVAFPDTNAGTSSANNYWFYGRGDAISSRTMTAHIPAYTDYSSTGAIPSWGVYRTGAVSLFRVWADGSVTVGGNTVLNASNYNSYSPTLGGTGASGTWGISITGNSTTTSQRAFSGDISTTGQGRFTGWYAGGAATGTAAEIGMSGGQGYIFVYNRDTSSYGTLNIAASAANMQFSGSTINVSSGALQQGGNQVLHASNYTSYSPSLGGTGASGTWGISITGSAASASTASLATAATRLQYNDGPRDLSDRLPNTFTRTVVFDFVGAGTGNGSGNYAGVMTYSPWTGTTASTGDSSYQLAFANQTGVNASGQPKLSIRNGIDSTWNAWHVLLHSGNYSSYALPLSGGMMTGHIGHIRGSHNYFERSSGVAVGGMGWHTDDVFYVAGHPGYGPNAGNNVKIYGFGGALGFGNNTYGDVFSMSSSGQFQIARRSGLATIQGVTGGSGSDGQMVIDSASGQYLYLNHYNGGIVVAEGGHRVLNANNYNSYSPTLTGGGASGTWGISITGSAASVGGLTPAKFFNNMGNNHSTYTDFNSVPGFGAYYVQQGGNSPTGTGSHQWYGFTLGLGNDYALSEYGSQIYYPRRAQNSETYIYVRDREGGSWSSWAKIRAGYADSAGSSSSVSTSSSTGIQSSYITTINTTTPGLANYGIAFSGSSAADSAQGVTWGWSGTNAQAGIYVQSSGSYGTKMYIATTDSFATGSKTAISIDHLGVTNFLRARPTALGNTILDASNYSSYALPLGGGTLTGNLAFGNGGSNTGAFIYHGAGAGDYGVVRFYQAGSNNQTIHAFGTAWQGGTLDSTAAGSINISGANGVTFGAWNVIDGSISTSGVLKVRTSAFVAGNAVLNASNYTSYSHSIATSDSRYSRKDTTSQWIKPYYEYGSYLTSETPSTLKDQMSGGGLRVDFMNPSYTGSGGWNHVITWSGYNMYNMYQLGGHYDGGTGTDLWVRSEANHGGTSWTAWRKLLNSSNYNSYAPTLTGGNASGTWGISISGRGYPRRSDGGDLNFYWSGQSGQPTWLWGGNDGANMYVYNPSNFSVSYASTCGTASRASRANGNMYIDDNYGNTVVGVYSSYRYQGVFAMGDSYKLAADGTSLGTLYGMAWSHPNAGGAAGNLTDHGLLIINNGGFRCAISNSIVASGNITAYSDERLKTNWRDMPEDYVTRLAEVKVGIYDRIDEKEMAQVGVSAQSFQKLLPQAIMTAKDEMQTLSVNYGSAALASAVELAKRVVDQEKRIAHLESLISKLIGD
jgi:hypothetical protein